MKNQYNRTINYPQAEYDRAEIVLMHEPEDELSYGTFCPDAALFKNYFYPEKAKNEHRQYQQLLRDLGMEVYTLRQLLLKGCVDEAGQWIDGEETERLRDLVASSLTTVAPEDDSIGLAAYKEKLIHDYSPNDVVRALLQQPKIQLERTAINTGVSAEYRVQPLMNLFYMRDQVITTSQGVVVGQMNSSQRMRECELVEFCLRKLGVKPIYRIEGKDAFLEGGDFMPMRYFDLINCGLRTTEGAIDQLMTNDLLGKNLLVVVHDGWKSQKQMHLDTYFNVIDSDLVTLNANRYHALPTDEKFLTVDVYMRRGVGDYQLISKNQPFVEFLTQKGFDIIPISEQDEDMLGNNFLCIQGREIAMVAGRSEELKEALRAKGVKVHWVTLDNLICGYGAAHCMTQVISRKRL